MNIKRLPKTDSWHLDPNSVLQKWGIIPIAARSGVAGSDWVPCQLPDGWNIEQKRGCHYLVDDRGLIRATIRLAELILNTRFVFQVSSVEQMEVVFEIIDQGEQRRAIRRYCAGYYARWSTRTHYDGTQHYPGYFSYRHETFFYLATKRKDGSFGFDAQAPYRHGSFHRQSIANMKRILNQSDFLALEESVKQLDAGEALDYFNSLPTDGSEWTAEFDFEF